MSHQNPLTRSKKQKARACFKANRLEDARLLLEEICAIDRLDSEAWFALAEIYQRLGKPDRAIACLRQLGLVKPDVPEIHYNLGNLLGTAAKSKEAIDSYQRALQIKPDYLEAWCNLGSAFDQLNMREEAIGCYRKALQLKPDFAEVHYNLGIALQAQGKYTEAEQAYLTALKMNPKFATAYINLGGVLDSLGRYEEAIMAYHQAEILDPDNDILYHNLGKLMKSQGQLEQAIHYYLKSLRLKPDSAETHTNLGNAYLARGQFEEAMACYKRSLAIDPTSPVANSDYLFSLHYSPTLTPEQIFQAHQNWGKTQASATLPNPGGGQPDTDAKLKIGYVSPDFRTHSVSYFIEPVLANHDRTRFDIVCYANLKQQDAATERLKKLAPSWRDINGLPDTNLAKLIQDDQIDILVDLAGHTANNRLRVFSRKPSPVQVTYLGYPNTTGLPQIDYRLTDSLADPSDQDKFHTEKLVRLAGGFLCYLPPANTPALASPPSKTNGYITFGSCNALPKVNQQVLALWANILTSIPGSRLIMKNTSLRDAATARRYRQMLAELSVNSERVELIGWQPNITDHLALYNSIDIALDTFPYNGTTTTCEALWMGVPVVTLAGNRHAGRVGVSLLERVGLPELIATNPEDYVRIASTLARDSGQLETLRLGLRERMATSPLCDAKRFTRELEDAYRAMWREWCAGLENEDRGK